MARLIIPEEILNGNVCQQCQSYLSVGPVLSCEGKAICGRCFHNNEIEGFKFKSLYNVVAEMLTFRCINYFIGCKYVFPFNGSLEHEERCTTNRRCGLCSFAGNGCQLIHHNNEKHPENVVDGDCFKFSIHNKGTKVLIFLIKGRIIYIKIFLEKDKLVEISSRITTQITCKQVSDFKLKFFDSATNLETSPIPSYAHKNPKKCVPLCKIPQAIITDCFPRGWCFCKLEFHDPTHDKVVASQSYVTKIAEDAYLKKSCGVLLNTELRLSDIRNDYYINRFLSKPPSAIKEVISSVLYSVQICVNCKRYIEAGVYLCPQYHILCMTCRTKPCPVCISFVDNNTRLHCQSLECDWDGCNQRTSIFEYMKHKRDCCFRRYKCPDENCGFVGCLDCLTGHWHLNPLIYDSKIIPGDMANCAVYWLNFKNRELFFVRMASSQSVHKLISIDEVDVVMRQIYKCKIFIEKFIAYILSAPNDAEINFNLFCAVKHTCFVRYLEVVTGERFYLTMNNQM